MTPEATDFVKMNLYKRNYSKKITIHTLVNHYYRLLLYKEVH